MLVVTLIPMDQCTQSAGLDSLFGHNFFSLPLQLDSQSAPTTQAIYRAADQAWRLILILLKFLMRSMAGFVRRREKDRLQGLGFD